MRSRQQEITEALVHLGARGPSGHFGCRCQRLRNVSSIPRCRGDAMLSPWQESRGEGRMPRVQGEKRGTFGEKGYPVVAVNVTAAVPMMRYSCFMRRHVVTEG